MLKTEGKHKKSHIEDNHYTIDIVVRDKGGNAGCQERGYFNTVVVMGRGERYM